MVSLKPKFSDPGPSENYSLKLTTYELPKGQSKNKIFVNGGGQDSVNYIQEFFMVHS